MDNLVKINFRIVQDQDDYPPVSVESVWAQLGTNVGEYIIDNVPFFARDATIGDIVTAKEEDGNLWFESIVHDSKNSLIRIVFFDPTCVDRVNAHATSLGCTTEYMVAYKILAVSAENSATLAKLREYLQHESSAGTIDYEEPILRD